jgi:hypothetical protein
MSAAKNNKKNKTKKISNNMNIIKSKNKDLQDCLNMYQGIRYVDINKFLWGNNKVDSRFQRCAILIINEILTNGIRLEDELTVYRNFNYFNQNNINNIEKLKVGELKFFKGLMSTGLDPDIVLTKSLSQCGIKDSKDKIQKIKKNIGVIKIPAGTPFFFLNFQGETEILLCPCNLNKIENSDEYLGKFQYEINKDYITELKKKTSKKNNQTNKKSNKKSNNKNTGLVELNEQIKMIPMNSEYFNEKMENLGKAPWDIYYPMNSGFIQSDRGAICISNIKYILKK